MHDLIQFTIGFKNDSCRWLLFNTKFNGGTMQIRFVKIYLFTIGFISAEYLLRQALHQV